VAGDQQKFQTAMVHAERFSQEAKWADAMKAYRFALAEFPNNEAAILGFGNAALVSGQIDMAQRAFQQALKVNPTNLVALSSMGDVQERVGQLDAAAETYLRMGNVYSSRTDLDSAIDSWIRATRLTSGHVDAQKKLADALARQGKTRPAAREYLTLAALYQRRQDNDRAVEQVDAARELLPDDPGIMAAYEAIQNGEIIQPGQISDISAAEEVVPDLDDEFAADDLFDLDELFSTEDEAGIPDARTGGLLESARQDAMEELANAIFEDDENPGTMLIMQALDLQSRDQLSDAISNYRQAIQLGSNQPAIYFNLGLLYRQTGQLGEAAEMLQVSAQVEKYAVCSSFALGETYYAAENYELAVKHFVEALRLIDLDTVSGQRSYQLAQGYENLADNFLEQANAETISRFVTALQGFFADPEWERRVYEARQRMNNVAEEGNTMSLAEFLETPETEVMVTTLAVTSEYMRANMLMTASEECLRAIQNAPSFLPLHARLADILLKQSRTDEAIDKYLYISRVYQMRGQPDQAVNIFHTILKLAPMDVTVRSKLIDLYTSQNDVTQALDQYLILANSYYQLAQVDRALEKYNEALRLAANVENGADWKVKALTRIADIFNQRFDWAGATSAYEKLLELGPGDEAIIRKLVDLYYKQNKHSEAVTALDNVLAIYDRQDPLQALELLKELAETYPNNMSLRQRLAVAYAQNNMNREAIAEYDALGEMQMENGLRDEAIQTIQAIINLGPNDVEGYRRLLAQISGGVV
jgi:tetratricopeptide (TPR) repeat protein